LVIIVVTNDDRNNRYSKNRNLWRKVYTFRRRKPNVRQFVDPKTDLSFSLDLNQTLRHRDFFIVQTIVSGPFVSSIIAEYDEGLIAFDNTTMAAAPFSFCFSDTPDAVVLSVESVSDYSNNIIPYGLGFNSCSMSVGVSAPFSGNIRYRAAYSVDGYPAVATSSFAPGSGSFTVYAGHITASDVTSFTTTYDVGPMGPSSFRNSPWDFFTNFGADVFIDKTVGITGSSGEISAPYNNPIYFIAFS
jgi:hypothetical protein